MAASALRLLRSTLHESGQTIAAYLEERQPAAAELNRVRARLAAEFERSQKLDSAGAFLESELNDARQHIRELREEIDAKPSDTAPPPPAAEPQKENPLIAENGRLNRLVLHLTDGSKFCEDCEKKDWVAGPQYLGCVAFGILTALEAHLIDRPIPDFLVWLAAAGLFLLIAPPLIVPAVLHWRRKVGLRSLARKWNKFLDRMRMHAA
jgi:hypothetical protein